MIASDNVVKLVEDTQHELSNLCEWMRRNKLSSNPQKTEFMIMGHPFKTKHLDLPEVLKLNYCDVKRMEKAKSLGVKIDEKLNCEEQFRRTKRKISGGLAALKRVKNVIPQSQLCNVYYALAETPFTLKRIQTNPYQYGYR